MDVADFTQLVVALTGLGSLWFGIRQWRRGRADTQQQQHAANQLSQQEVDLQRRERNLEELRELADQRREDAERDRAALEATRNELAQRRVTEEQLRQALVAAASTIDQLRHTVLDETARAAGAQAVIEIRHLLRQPNTTPGGTE